MKKKPIIGVSLDYLHDCDSAKYSPFPWYALRQHYSIAIEKYGSIPIFLPFESYSDCDEIISLIDGLLIPGGDFHIPPSIYGQEIVYHELTFGNERAESELKLIEKVIENNMPFLGICHGMQLLNVFFGGTLYQNIQKQKPGAINHSSSTSRNEPYHEIIINDDTKLLSIAKNIKSFYTNSNHKQAVSEIGKGLTISAYCKEDGVIEAIESLTHDYVIGVEWHPELFTTNTLDDCLFKSFVDASRKYGDTKSLKNYL